jgi:hypothetical protein
VSAAGHQGFRFAENWQEGIRETILPTSAKSLFPGDFAKRFFWVEGLPDSIRLDRVSGTTGRTTPTKETNDEPPQVFFLDDLRFR